MDFCVSIGTRVYSSLNATYRLNRGCIKGIAVFQQRYDAQATPDDSAVSSPLVQTRTLGICYSLYCEYSGFACGGATLKDSTAITDSQPERRGVSHSNGIGFVARVAIK